MPRSPSHRSIVREIRKCLRWTQFELARRIGTTMTTINRIENGSLKISRKLAWRLCWASGVSYKDIVENKSGVPRNRYGNLNPETHKLFEKGASEWTDEQLASLVDNAKYLAETLHRAARETEKNEKKIWSLDAAIQLAFEEVAEEFGLTRAVTRIRTINTVVGFF